jgi:uncharacterized protein (DUF433 family)
LFFPEGIAYDRNRFNRTAATAPLFNYVVRVAGTRVTLDTIVAPFDAGATAEEIAQQYSSVALADVYSVITYYLRHKSAVSAYLQTRHEQAATVREEVERRFPPSGIRERLIARRQ